MNYLLTVSDFVILWYNQRFQYDNKITIPRSKNLAEFVLGPIVDVAIEKPRIGSHHCAPLPR